MTVNHLLTHTMGIGHKSMLNSEGGYENIHNYILGIPSDVPIGSEVLYSCPGYILLGKILEQVFSERLDKLFLDFKTAKLGNGQKHRHGKEYASEICDIIGKYRKF